MNFEAEIATKLRELLVRFTGLPQGLSVGPVTRTPAAAAIRSIAERAQAEDNADGQG
jgi:hypothetical protein